MSDALAWLCYAGAAAGLLFYFFVWVRRPDAIRLLNNSGLLFTGFGLGLLPLALVGRDPGEDRYVYLTVAFLWLALLAQAVAAFRERRAWDGVDRRRKPEWDGTDRRGGREWDGVDRRGDRTGPTA